MFTLCSLKVGIENYLPSEAEEMVAAMALLSSLDSAAQAILAAQRELQQVINEVETSQVAEQLEKALERASEVRFAGYWTASQQC